MTTYKYCESCDQNVIYDPPQPKVLTHAIIFPLSCIGGNSPHFCKKMGNGKSIHEIVNCNCLTRTTET